MLSELKVNVSTSVDRLAMAVCFTPSYNTLSYTSSTSSTRPCSRASSTTPFSKSSEYSAPVGLLGLMMTMPRVRDVILARMSARSGIQSFDSSHT